MKARLPKGYGRPDPNAMMRQVQKMQDDIRAKQEELEAKEYTGTASGEMVTVTMNGKHEITAVKIKPEVWTVISGTGHAILDGVRRDVKAGDILTMPAGCRHTVFADSELKIIEVQLGPAISVEDKQKYPLPQA